MRLALRILLRHGDRPVSSHEDINRYGISN
jgi:hypothetical protein